MAALPQIARMSAIPICLTARFWMNAEAAQLPHIQEHAPDHDPVTFQELDAISSAADSAAIWALQNLSTKAMSEFTPKLGYILRVSPRHAQFCHARSNSSRGVPSFPMGNWIGYSPSSSPQPSMATLSPQQYSAIPEKYLIRTDTHTKRTYICIPGGAEIALNGTNNDKTAEGSTTTSTTTATQAKCDHCACIHGSARPSSGGVNPLAPKTLCHFHRFYMTTGKTLTQCEQLALAQLDRDGVAWTPQQTVVFVTLLKRRLSQLALHHDSEPLPSLTAAQSRVLGIDYGAVGEGRSMVKGQRTMAGTIGEDTYENVLVEEHIAGLVAGVLSSTDEDDVFT